MIRADDTAEAEELGSAGVVLDATHVHRARRGVIPARAEPARVVRSDDFEVEPTSCHTRGGQKQDETSGRSRYDNFAR